MRSAAVATARSRSRQISRANAAPSASVSASASISGERCSVIAPAQFPFMLARRDVEIGVDEFDRLIDALGRENATGK